MWTQSTRGSPAALEVEREIFLVLSEIGCLGYGTVVLTNKRWKMGFKFEVWSTSGKAE